MKKAFVVFTLTLLLALGVSAAFGLSLAESRDKVEVTAETLAGDPAAAEGLTAAQTVHYGYELFWDLSIPLDRPEDAVVDFTYDHDSSWHHFFRQEPYFQVSGPGTSYNHAFYNEGTTLEALLGQDSPHVQSAISPDPNYVLLEEAIREIADRAPNGEAYAETIKLADYSDTYPLTLQTTFSQLPDDHRNPDQSFNDFFRFPVPEDTEITISIVKTPDGLISELFTADPRSDQRPETLFAWVGSDFYFTFTPDSKLNFSNTPGGFGIYHLDYVQPDDLTTPVYLDMNTLENICPLPEGAAVLDLTLSPHGTWLFVTYYHNSKYVCLVLETATNTILQTLDVPAPAPNIKEVNTYDYFNKPYSYKVTDWPITGALAGDNFLVLLGEEAADLHLYTLTDTGYTYAFSAPTPGHVLYLPRGHLTGVWTGEKLALGSVSSEFDHCTGLTLSVFEDGALTYQGEYSTSLDHLSYAPNNEAPPLYRTMDLLPGAALAFVP